MCLRGKILGQRMRARIFILIFEVKLCAWIFGHKTSTSKIEVKVCAYEVKIRAYEVKSGAYKVKIRACEVKICAYKLKSWGRKSRHVFLP